MLSPIALLLRAMRILISSQNEHPTLEPTSFVGKLRISGAASSRLRRCPVQAWPFPIHCLEDVPWTPHYLTHLRLFD